MEKPSISVGFRLAGYRIQATRFRRVARTRRAATLPRRTTLVGSGTVPAGGPPVPTGPVLPVVADRISTAKKTLGLPPDESCWKLAAVKPVPLRTTVLEPT